MAEGKDGRNKIVATHDTKRTLGAEAGDKKKRCVYCRCDGLERVNGEVRKS